MQLDVICCSDVACPHSPVRWFSKWPKRGALVTENCSRSAELSRSLAARWAEVMKMPWRPALRDTTVLGLRLVVREGGALSASST